MGGLNVFKYKTSYFLVLSSEHCFDLSQQDLFDLEQPSFLVVVVFFFFVLVESVNIPVLFTSWFEVDKAGVKAKARPVNPAIKTTIISFFIFIKF